MYFLFYSCCSGYDRYFYQQTELKKEVTMASILRANEALVPPFSLFHLPPFVPGSSGVALPKPGADTIVCIAPGEGKTYNDNWKQELTLHRGDPHAALAPDDHYPNQVLARDCRVVPGLDQNEPRARALREFWAGLGFGDDDFRTAWLEYLDTFDPKQHPKWVDEVRAAVGRGELFFTAKKEQPVRVLGRVDLRFQTSEGATGLEDGMVIVVHPDDPTNTWALRGEKFDQRYNWVDLPSGLTVPDQE